MLVDRVLSDWQCVVLKILLLPGNAVLKEVLDKRREIHGEETYIETPQPKCDPNQEYTLSITPKPNPNSEDSIIILPKKAKIDESSFINYNATFVINLLEKCEHLRLFLKDSNTSESAWEAFVNLSAFAPRKQQVQRSLSPPAKEGLLSVRNSFISRVSAPVLDQLLDHLLEKRVLQDVELEKANEKHVRHEKARFVIDTVQRKGKAACRIMTLFLIENDPYLSKELRLDSQPLPHLTRNRERAEVEEIDDPSPSKKRRKKRRRRKKKFDLTLCIC